MKKKLKRIGKILMILLLCFICFVVIKIIRFQFNVVKDINIKSGELTLSLPFERAQKENIKPVSAMNFDKEQANKIDDIKIYINNKIISPVDSFYEYRRRYYVSLASVSDYNINLNDGVIRKLRGEILDINNKKYISINYIENVLNYKSAWDDEKREIYIYSKEQNVPKLDNSNIADNSKVALIRLEDVACSGQKSDVEYINKFKIMVDMLNANQEKFHIAWIPRYVAPDSGIDNDLTTENTFINCDFVNLLDYIINNGGEIGLHGYTHQFKDTTSGAGIELSMFNNNEESEVRFVAENAIRTANYLNIPYKFFESPHYKATRSQQKILEEYFDVLFEPYAGYWNLRPLVSLTNKSTIYMPTSLGYVKDQDGSEMVNEINDRWSNDAAAMFFHPYKELAYINIKQIKDGKLEFEYNQNSPLYNISNALKINNYSTIHVSEINVIN